MTNASAIRLSNVSRWYGNVVAVNDVSFTLGAGVTGLLGPNGAGKTTILHMMAGLLRPSAGDVLIDGASAGPGNLLDLLPGEVGGVEVYPRAAHIPPRFVPPGIQPQCGMILVWTKYGLRNR